MLKMFITEAVVSKGYDDAPAIRFFESENKSQIANFRIGKRVYDSKVEGNHRWLNFTVKAFGDLVERIKKMKLKEGSCVNLVARYDEESWTDKSSGEVKTMPALILDELEYSGIGGGQKKQDGGQPEQPVKAATQPKAPDSDQMPGNFTGFESFTGSDNPYF